MFLDVPAFAVFEVEMNHRGWSGPHHGRSSIAQDHSRAMRVRFMVLSSTGSGVSSQKIFGAAELVAIRDVCGSLSSSVEVIASAKPSR